MKKKFLIIFFLISFISPIIAQTPFAIENYTISDGLSQSSITCIFQSRDGILWFGTQDGLNEYDGYEFTSFRLNPQDSNSLSNNYINDIEEDYSGNMYIATRAGLNIWDRKKDKYKVIPSINNNTNILKLKYFNNALWILTENSLSKLNENNLIEHNFFNTDPNTVRYELNTLDIQIDADTNIWIATKDGVNIFNTKHKQFYRIHDNGSNSLSNNRIRSIFIDINSNVLIGTFNGLNKFYRNTGKIQNIYYEDNQDLLRENTINSILIDKNYNNWIGTKNGLKTLKNNKIVEFHSDELNAINDQVTEIFEDNTGNVWVGTLSKGVFKIILHKPKFYNFTNFPNVADRTVFGLYANDSTIWTGSNGLFIIDKKTKKIIYHNDLITNDSIQEITVYFIGKFNNYLWLGTDNGVYIVDEKTYQIESFFDFFDIEYKSVYEKLKIYHIAKDRFNNFWFATSGGLLFFDGKDFTSYKYNESENSISSDIIIKLLLDKNKIWIATYNGLNCFDLKSKTFKNWGKEEGLPSIFCMDICKTERNTLWISTTSGLSKMNIKNETFENFNIINIGFKNDFFYTITKNKKYLWLTSNYGVVKFNYLNYSFETFELKDGLPSLECNINSVYTDNDEYYYVGGNNGISWCRFKDTTFIKIAPKVVIYKIEYQGYNESKKIINFPDSNKVYNLDYKGLVTIYFTMPEYTHTENNKFEYKIKEINDDWSNEQYSNDITLAGISPGTYTLLIRGANSQGVWNYSPAKLQFKIKPPFWRTTLAYSLYIFLFIIIILAVFLYIYKRFKNENKILQEKNLVLQELNMQRKLLEDKNKNITDSINYAKKIIEAILPPVENFNNLIPESFIFFMPKDIVSGDFYWFAEKNDNIFIASVDCTGHGIPGAFMSIIGINLLESILNDGITDPAIFLNIMNNEIISTLKKDMDKKHLKDGMDMTMCIIDKRRRQIKYAGAYNPAYVIRDESIIQLKGDRKSVGNDFDLSPFTPFSMKIRENDIIYIFSDGYTDQFGERTGKKFKFRRFRLLLLSIHKLPFDEQKQKLNDAFQDWKGKSEQVDDVLIIGFKPLSFQNE